MKCSLGDGIEESRVNFTALYTAGNLTLEIFPYCGADGELDVMVSQIGREGPSIKDVRVRNSLWRACTCGVCTYASWGAFTYDVCTSFGFCH